MHTNFESYFGPDDDFDPNADRGDDFEPTEDLPDETTHPVTGQPRGKDGKFASKGADKEDDEDGAVGGDLELDKKIGDKGGQGGKPSEDADRGDEVEEEEDEEEEEEEEEEEADGEKPGKGKGKDDKNLPIRFNKMKEQRDRERERADALAAELEKLRKPAEPAAPAKDPVAEINAELDGLYEQVEEARADGNTKEAAQLQRKIDGLNRKIASIEAEKVSKKTTAQDAEGRRFDALLTVMEARIPELNPDSEDFSQESVQDLEDLVVGYERSGMTASAALVRAVNRLFKVDLTKKAAPTPKKEDEVGGDGKGKKPAPKKGDLKKSADASRKQPPDSSRHGSDQDNQKIDIAKLNDAEFAALPESVKAKYRGDDV